MSAYFIGMGVTLLFMLYTVNQSEDAREMAQMGPGLLGLAIIVLMAMVFWPFALVIVVLSLLIKWVAK